MNAVLRWLAGSGPTCRFCPVEEFEMHQPTCFVMFVYEAMDFWDVAHDQDLRLRYGLRPGQLINRWWKS